VCANVVLAGSLLRELLREEDMHCNKLCSQNAENEESRSVHCGPEPLIIQSNAAGRIWLPFGAETPRTAASM